jgi:hypothetical protein
MLGNFATIEILNAKVAQNLEQVSQAEQRKIHTINLRADHVLHRPVNAENEKRLDDQIDTD